MKPALAAIVAILVFPFFCTYNYVHYYRHLHAQDDTRSARDSIIVTWLIAALLAFVLGLIGRPGLSTLLAHTSLLAYAVAYVTTVVAYSAWIFVHSARQEILLFRHTIFLPVVLSVVMTAFTGAVLVNVQLADSALILLILVALAFMYLMDAATSRQLFFYASCGILAFLCSGAFLALATSRVPVVIAPQVDRLASACHVLVLCTALGFYIGLFESWRHTASMPSLASKYDALGADKRVLPGRFMNHDSAILLALYLFLVILPVLYLYPAFQTLFLLLAALHGVVSLLVWHTLGAHSPEMYERVRWLKVILGYVFLLLFPFNSFRLIPTSPVLPTVVGLLGITLLPAAAVGLWRCHSAIDHSASHPKYLRLVLPWALGLVASALYLLFFVWREALGDTGTRAKLDVIVMYYLLLALGAVAFAWHRDHFTRIRDVLRRIFHRDPEEGPAPPSSSGPDAPTPLQIIAGCLQVCRVQTALLIYAASAPAAILTGGLSVVSLLTAAPLAILSMAGFALNDYHDWRADEINLRHRAIPSGRVSRSLAFAIAISLFGIAVIVALLIIRSFAAMMLLSCVGLALMFYHRATAVAPGAKNVITAALCASPIVFNALMFRGYGVDMLLVASIICLITGREILMDIRDMSGDRAVGRSSLPLTIGAMPSELLAWSLAFAGAIAFAVSKVEVAGHGLGFDLALSGVLLLSLLLWRNGAKRRFRPVAIEVLKFSLLVIMVAYYF